MGAMSVMMTNQEYNANKQNIQTELDYQKQLKKDLKNKKISQKEYDEYLAQSQSRLNSDLEANMTLMQNQINLIISQAQAELDILNKTISKRKEALKAKKDYYEL